MSKYLIIRNELIANGWTEFNQFDDDLSGVSLINRLSKSNDLVEWIELNSIIGLETKSSRIM